MKQDLRQSQVQALEEHKQVSKDLTAAHNATKTLQSTHNAFVAKASTEIATAQRKKKSLQNKYNNAVYQQDQILQAKMGVEEKLSRVDKECNLTKQDPKCAKKDLRISEKLLENKTEQCELWQQRSEALYSMLLSELNNTFDGDDEALEHVTKSLHQTFGAHFK